MLTPEQVDALPFRFRTAPVEIGRKVADSNGVECKWEMIWLLNWSTGRRVPGDALEPHHRAQGHAHPRPGFVHPSRAPAPSYFIPHNVFIN